MLGFKNTGSTIKTERFLKSLTTDKLFSDLNRYGDMGIEALSRATPKDTTKTANSWRYRITNSRGKVGIEWYNTNVVDGVPIAIILQYGHGTGTGGWVSGYDYINPAIQPIFDKISENVWKKVKNG